MRQVIFAVLAGFALAGCNTIAGVGEDITGAARSVQGGTSGGY
ncbi:hypothetical protein [uncultured Paracoccus sp.]